MFYNIETSGQQVIFKLLKVPLSYMKLIRRISTTFSSENVTFGRRQYNISIFSNFLFEANKQDARILQMYNYARTNDKFSSCLFS